MQTLVHTDPVAVRRRLHRLGLAPDVLLNAVRAAYAAWSNCTDLDPAMYPGQTMWATAVRHLRIGLLPTWQLCEAGNFSLTLSPDKQVAIGVATGDDGTGVADRVPVTKSRKGPRTMEAVAANNAQLGLDLAFADGWAPPLSDPDELGAYVTWLLLIYRDHSEVRCELSLPLGFDEYDRVSAWTERIILSSIDTTPLRELDLEERQLPIDVPVQRRA